MTDTKMLLKVIEESGLKKAFIAKSIGLSPFGLSKKINNESEFKASEIEKLCEILHIDDFQTRQKIFFATQ